MPFTDALVQSETQKTLDRIWTQLVDSIFYIWRETTTPIHPSITESLFSVWIEIHSFINFLIISSCLKILFSSLYLFKFQKKKKTTSLKLF